MVKRNAVNLDCVETLKDAFRDVFIFPFVRKGWLNSEIIFITHFLLLLIQYPF